VAWACRRNKIELSFKTPKFPRLAGKKIPSTNIQAPEKFQTPNFNRRPNFVWSLNFEVSLELGAVLYQFNCSGGL
jgi:hypothetical protein